MKKSSFIIGIIVILLEIFVFNFSFIKSLFYNETKINLNDVEFFDMKESTTSNNYYIESNESYFVFDINKKVNIVGYDGLFKDIDILDPIRTITVEKKSFAKLVAETMISIVEKNIKQVVHKEIRPELVK